MALPGPRTSASFCAGVVCFFAHTGSASMAMGLRLGAVPEKVTVPVIDEPAPAAPGQADNATSPVARHNVLNLARMSGSLVIANLATWSPSTLPFFGPRVRRLYTGPVVCATCTPTSEPVRFRSLDAARSRSTCEGERRSVPACSGVLERQGFGKSRVAQWDERLPPHQPSRRRDKAPADRDERRHVEDRRTDAFRMERRHDLPVDIDEVHGEEPHAS